MVTGLFPPPGVHSEHCPHELPIRSFFANYRFSVALGPGEHTKRLSHHLTELPVMHREDGNVPGTGWKSPFPLVHQRSLC